jgi:parallel beta-helix repeat protein
LLSMSRKLALVLVTGASALALSAGPAMAKELRVDDNGAQCPKADFTTIQAAVTAAQPGDKIKVCPGTYQEQVRIDNKNRLKLEALKKQEATIKFPTTTTPPNALVHIRNSDDVDVRGFVISGPFFFPGCAGGADRNIGVYVDDSEDAKLTDNRITGIKNANPALYGCQDGLGVQVGREVLGSVGTADVDHNVIEDYQKGGLVVDGAGSHGDVDHNVIRSTDPAVQIITAPNGAQISREATARVDHNTISGNLYTGPQDAGGTGILLCGDPDLLCTGLVGGVKVDHNEVFNNDDGISLFDADNQEISHNDSHDNVKFDGLFADEKSEGNLFLGNDAFNNAEFDCHDESTGTGTAGTANEWKSNRGNTSEPPGICRPF